MTPDSINPLARIRARSLMGAIVVLATIVLASPSPAATPAPSQTPSQNAAPVEQEEPAEASVDLVQRLRGSGPNIRRNLNQVLSSFGALPAVPNLMWAELDADSAVTGWQLFGVFLAAFFVGAGVELILRRAARPGGTQADLGSADEWRSRLGMLVLRAVIDLFSIAAFAGGSLAVMLIIDLKSELSNLLFIDLLWLIVMVRVAGTVSRAVLAPRTSALRLLPLDDAPALILHRQVVGIAALILILRLHTNVMADFGLPLELSQLVGIILSAVVVLVIVGMILYWREGVAVMLLGGRSASDERVSPLQRKFAGSCHVLAIAYVIGVWLFAAGVRLATGEIVFFPGIVSLLALVAVPVADLGLRALAHRWFGPQPEEPTSTDSTAISKEAPSYEAVALRNMRILLAIIVVMVLAKAWRIDLPSIVQGIFGARLANALLDVSITLLLAYALWSVVKTAVARHARSEPEASESVPGSGDAGGTGATRLQTLLPLVQKFLLVTLVVIITMVALSSAGVEIGPLVAGAGMVGIAIGFGAQALVRDIVSGLFFLIDDAFRMGEYVEIGDTRGTVEKISIRSMQLRHHNGPVHTVPFGEIRQLTNYSRDWHIMKFELRLPFETNINGVRKLIKKVGEKMMEDPEFGPKMLGPLKSQGVNRMDDSALIIRCKVPCVPGEQFMVRREAYTRIQKTFEENDIHFAPRRVIVEATTPEQAAQAAADILENEAEKAQKKPDDRG